MVWKIAIRSLDRSEDLSFLHYFHVNLGPTQVNIQGLPEAPIQSPPIHPWQPTTQPHVVLKLIICGWSCTFLPLYSFMSRHVTKAQGHLYLYYCNFTLKYLIVSLFFGATAPPPQWARTSSFTRFRDHTQRRIKVGRAPLDE